MPELPSGTVTFLFTDIEGSTRLLHDLGDDYAKALAEHHRLLRDAFTRHGGVEVSTEGDAFFVAFARAKDALAAAAEGQQALGGGPVRVRMGLHTGEPLITEEGYVGIDVHRAARIAAVGHGGQVVISQTTRDLLDSEPELRELGEHRLKDLSDPQRLYQLGETDFPPLKTLNNSNLPVQPTPLVGREGEICEVGELVRANRLVTLTGPGGSGKTRLAVQAAAELIDEFPEGVWWVSLAAVRDPELVAPTIAASLVVKEPQTLEDFLREKEGLLLLDNFEQLLAAAPMLGHLLRAAPRVHLLVTSRASLRLTGEHEYPVPPLADDEAVTLFTERAVAVTPGFEPDEHVLEICRRLDNLPLALELAAARVRVLTPQAILGRLEQRLPLLVGGARDAPERQRTLRATIEWSYELLEREGQELFARLAVFVGGFTLEAAEAVCGAEPHLGSDVLSGITSLVEKSLVRVEGELRGLPRYSMLESIHEYAHERLEARGGEALRRRHANYFLSLARRGREAMSGPEQAGWLELLERDHDNFRAVLAGDDDDVKLELTGYLWRFWLRRGYMEEAQRELAQVLEQDVHDAGMRASALCGAAYIAYIRNELSSAKRFASEALRLFEGLGDARGVAQAATDLGNAFLLEGDYERARQLFMNALESAREANDLSLVALAIGDLAGLALTQGDYERASVECEESLMLERQLQRPIGIAISLVNLGIVAIHLDRPEKAKPPIRESLEILYQLHDQHMIALCLSLAASVAVAESRLGEAACLLAMADSIEEELGSHGFEPGEQRLHQETSKMVRARLGADEFTRSVELGRATTLDKAVAFALRVLR